MREKGIANHELNSIMGIEYPLWNEPLAKPMVAKNSVHIWRATTEIPDRNFTRLQSLLSCDERVRADRLRFECDRHRFVVARGLLRSILGLYLGCTPSELRFSYSKYGKPLLEGPHNERHLSFNLAHSSMMALYVITLRREIGVDLERILYDFEIEKIAQHFFSPNETRELLSIEVNARVRAFYDCWTRKEAFIKAMGTGLSFPLDQFDVSLSPGEAVLLRTQWDINERSRWSLKSIDVNPEYSAAVVVEGHDWQPSYWQATNDMLFD